MLSVKLGDNRYHFIVFGVTQSGVALHMLSVKLGASGTIFIVFGMTQSGIVLHMYAEYQYRS